MSREKLQSVSIKKKKKKAQIEPIDGNDNVLLSLCCFLCMLVKKWSQSV